jgi:hypothetical protein
MSSYVRSVVAAPDFTARACPCQASKERSQKLTNENLKSAKNQSGG